MLPECSRFPLSRRSLLTASLASLALLAPRPTLASPAAGMHMAAACTDACITEYELPRAGKGPQCGTGTGYAIGRLGADGSITEHPVHYPSAIVVGPDNAFWFGEQIANKIGRLTIDGRLTEFPVATVGKLQFRDCAYESSAPAEGTILVGPDENLWFSETVGNNIVRMTLNGQMHEFEVPTSDSGPISLAVGPDGALWFIERLASKVGRITIDGAISGIPDADRQCLSK